MGGAPRALPWSSVRARAGGHGGRGVIGLADESAGFGARGLWRGRVPDLRWKKKVLVEAVALSVALGALGSFRAEVTPCERLAGPVTPPACRSPDPRPERSVEVPPPGGGSQPTTSGLRWPPGPSTPRNPQAPEPRGGGQHGNPDNALDASLRQPLAFHFRS